MSYEEQIMFKDKYPSIFLPQMEAIVFIILRNARSFENWGIFNNELDYEPEFSTSR